ncbi:MAG: magnesium transporter MgtE N-terminal domain-containing protein [Terriglobales bacterium]
MTGLALSELLGTPVLDSTGVRGGRVREVALFPQEDPSRVHALVVRTGSGDRLLPWRCFVAISAQQVRASIPQTAWPGFNGGEGLLLLERDLLDQQIIDVHGRKVVRVNDVDFQQTFTNNEAALKILEVDVGMRGAVRRLLKGLVPLRALEGIVSYLPQRVIPWEFVDLIETDPSRRVKLKIAHHRLARLHPADIADIIEELSPAEREAVFETLNEEVAAGTLEEVDPKLQVSIVESLDSERAADIVEEMDPAAAADLLGELSEETSEEILEEMEPHEREDVAELLEVKDNTAAGHMTTEFIAVPRSATVFDVIEIMRHFEGSVEAVSTIFVFGPGRKLLGSVPLARMVLAPTDSKMGSLIVEPMIFVRAGASEKEAAELFDKYNLLSLPVVDKQGRLTGVITADDVISLLREKQ